MERRELFSFLSSSLKGAGNEKEIIIRPPYYSDIIAFDTECQNCDGKCATLCQEQIIIIGEDKTPRLSFSNSGCTYCDDCAIACEPDVLRVEDVRQIDVGVRINESTCMEFKAMFMPTIDQEKCTSCGFCISRCPSAAINIKVIKS